MHHSPRQPAPDRPAARARSPLRALVRRTSRHRRIATAHLLRGACYGLGTGAVTLLAVWAEQYI
ncbi:hypothetical protein ACFYXL_33030 [Streptomyces tsukubensis]|uniref:hypothetical protein n=1 Tax=Streptomyces tsukubensis TaxID=83656 RepID=UPI0036C0BD4E